MKHLIFKLLFFCFLLVASPLSAQTPNDGLDDSAAFQAAINKACATTGNFHIGTVGAYNVWNLRPCNGLSITGSPGVVLRRSGAGPIIRSAYTDPLISNLTIRGLRFDGNKDAAPRPPQAQGSCIKLERVRNITIESNEFVNCYDASVLIGNPIPGEGGKIRLLNNVSTNPAHDNKIDGQFWGSYGVAGGDEVIISQNICRDSSTENWQNYCIDLEPVQNWAMRRAIISDNILVNGSIMLRPSSTAVVQDVIFSGNLIDFQRASGAGAAIRVTGGVGGVGVLSINNNTIKLGGGKLGSIHVQTPGFIKINGNLLQNTIGTFGGIYVHSATLADVDGNTIHGLIGNQTTNPNQVGIQFVNVALGKASGNYIHAGAATPAGIVAGIKKSNSPNVQLGPNFYHNIVVTGQ